MKRPRPNAGKLPRYIEAMIASGKLSSGQQLPPLRELAEAFQLSPSTARRAIKELCDRGTLEFRHGSGTFVAPRPPEGAKTYRLSVFCENWISESYCAYALSGLQSRAVLANWQLKIFFRGLPSEEEYSLPPEAWTSDAVAFLGCFDTFWKKSPGAIPDNKPAAGMEMHDNRSGLLSTVTLDPFSAADLACRYFHGLGLTHVEVIKSHMPVHEVRSRLFREAWQAYGSSEERWFNSYDPLPEYLADRGYFFDSGSHFQDQAKRYREGRGVILAEYPNILAVDGKSLIFPEFEPANTISIDWFQAGELVFEECARRVLNPGAPARRIYIEPVLSPWEKTAPPLQDQSNANNAGNLLKKRSLQ